MTKDQLLSILSQIGLHEKEAEAYISGLSLGPTTIQSLARATEIKRTTLYTVIESLIQKGLFKIQQSGFKKLFVAESPEKLEVLFDERKNLLKKSLPDLNSLYNFKGSESLLEYYKGLQSVKNVYNSLIEEIQPHEPYYVMGNQTKWYSLDSKFFQSFMERRAKLLIDIRMLLIDTPEAQKLKKFQKNYNVRVKVLPKKTKLLTNLVITPQKVVIHQLIDPVFALVIRNQSVITMHQETFRVMWDAA